MFISLHPEFCRIHLTKERFANPPTPPRFCAYLRAHIEGASISGLSQAEGERIVSIYLRKKESDRVRKFILVIELTGKSSNIILVDESGVILDAMRYFPPQKGCPRPIMPRIKLLSLPPGGRRKGHKIQKNGVRSWSEAVETYYRRVEDEELEKRERSSLVRTIKDYIKRMEKKMDNIHGDLAGAERDKDASRLGELLTVNYHKIKKGMAYIVLDDLYSDPPKEIRIPLDESIEPDENVWRYFKKAKKAKKAVEMGRKRILRIEMELERLRRLQDEAKASRNMVEVRVVKNRLFEGGYAQDRGKRNEIAEDSAIPIRRFMTTDGIEVLCGKNSRGNEIIRRDLARAHDLWFHVKDMPGSHVLLKLRDQRTPPTNRAMEEAASIAAYYSKASSGTKAEVIYTEARHLKKPRGGKPGVVRIERYKTIYVRPEVKDL